MSPAGQKANWRVFQLKDRAVLPSNLALAFKEKPMHDNLLENISNEERALEKEAPSFRHGSSLLQTFSFTEMKIFSNAIGRFYF